MRKNEAFMHESNLRSQRSKRSQAWRDATLALAGVGLLGLGASPLDAQDPPPTAADTAAPPPVIAAPDPQPSAAAAPASASPEPQPSAAAAPASASPAPQPSAAAAPASAPPPAAAPPPVAAADSDAPWGTEAGTWEVGYFWGVFMPSKKHALYDTTRANPSWQRLERVTPDLGLRGAVFPWRVLGFEFEAALIPSQTRTTGDAVTLWGARGQLVLQAPTRAIVPFLVVGGGVLGMSSPKRVLGNDVDPVFHVGLGAKGYVTPNLAVRVDVRDIIAESRDSSTPTMHWEALVGLSIVLGRTPPPPPPPPDGDRDGVPDASDQCPNEIGLPPSGCAPIVLPPDSDGDGVADPDDRCPLAAGPVNPDPAANGCPPPPDADGDGVADADDRCPSLAGDAADGCVADRDSDAIPDRADKCPDQPETKNGYQDDDGCPDELPQAVAAFTGAIAGISFPTGQAALAASSRPTLDAAANVLSEYPELRVEVSGHTDSSGELERNIALSTQRADAVAAYLVSKGIASDRIETRGVGPNEPLGDNATKEGRQKNRRIEFKLLPKAAETPAPSEPVSPHGI
jgi:outer membrane protein OmpA-like peptidoglycan-associated protein